jgi:integrase/recombinase XerD
MRHRIFPPYYSCRYEDSPVRDWLMDFEVWLRAASYTLTPMRTHMCVVRSALEQEAPQARDASFSASDLNRMFARFKQNRFHRGTEGVFAKFLCSSGQWLITPLQGRHIDLVQAFRDYGKEMRGLSRSHTDRQVTIINDFLDQTVTAAHPLADVVLGDIERYVHRCAPGLDRSSLMKRIGYLRSFFRFCYDRGEITFCPEHIDTARKYRGERPPRAIAWEMTQQLLASIDRSTPMGERDYAILFLIAHYGLRTGEIPPLGINSIDWKRHVLLVVQGKTHSTLVLPMAAPIECVLKNYLRRGRPHTKRSELFLTVVAPTGPMTTPSINAMFQRQVTKSGLPLGTASPYGLRHGFAMRLLEQGVGIKAIGDLLGHGGLDSTAVYLRLHTEALRDVALPMPAGTMTAGDLS